VNFIHKVPLAPSKCLSKWMKVDKWDNFQNGSLKFFFSFIFWFIFSNMKPLSDLAPRLLVIQIQIQIQAVWYMNMVQNQNIGLFIYIYKYPTSTIVLKKRWYHKPSYIFTSIKTNQIFKNLHWWPLLNFSLLSFQLSNFISKLYLSNFNFHNSNLTFLSISNLYTCLLKRFFKLLTYKIDIGTSIYLEGSLKITYALSKTTLTKNKLQIYFNQIFRRYPAQYID